MDDQTFAALAHAHRRQILLTLAARDPDATLDAAAAVPDADPGELRLSLFHTHLPRLQAAGLVEWDRDGLAVSRGPRFEVVAPVLALLEDGGGLRQVPA